MRLSVRSRSIYATGSVADSRRRLQGFGSRVN